MLRWISSILGKPEETIPTPRVAASKNPHSDPTETGSFVSPRSSPPPLLSSCPSPSPLSISTSPPISPPDIGQGKDSETTTSTSSNHDQKKEFSLHLHVQETPSPAGRSPHLQHDAHVDQPRSDCDEEKNKTNQKNSTTPITRDQSCSCSRSRSNSRKRRASSVSRSCSSSLSRSPRISRSSSKSSSRSRSRRRSRRGNRQSYYDASSRSRSPYSTRSRSRSNGERKNGKKTRKISTRSRSQKRHRDHSPSGRTAFQKVRAIPYPFSSFLFFTNNESHFQQISEKEVRDLFLDSLEDVSRRKGFPFNISLINDRMRHLYPPYHIKNTSFDQFGSLCKYMNSKVIMTILPRQLPVLTVHGFSEICRT